VGQTYGQKKEKAKLAMVMLLCVATVRARMSIAPGVGHGLSILGLISISLLCSYIAGVSSIVPVLINQNVPVAVIKFLEVRFVNFL